MPQYKIDRKAAAYAVGDYDSGHFVQRAGIRRYKGKANYLESEYYRFLNRIAFFGNNKHLQINANKFATLYKIEDDMLNEAKYCRKSSSIPRVIYARKDTDFYKKVFLPQRLYHCDFLILAAREEFKKLFVLRRNDNDFANKMGYENIDDYKHAMISDVAMHVVAPNEPKRSFIEGMQRVILDRRRFVGSGGASTIDGSLKKSENSEELMLKSYVLQKTILSGRSCLKYNTEYKINNDYAKTDKIDIKVIDNSTNPSPKNKNEIVNTVDAILKPTYLTIEDLEVLQDVNKYRKLLGQTKVKATIKEYKELGEKLQKGNTDNCFAALSNMAQLLVSTHDPDLRVQSCRPQYCPDTGCSLLAWDRMMGAMCDTNYDGIKEQKDYKFMQRLKTVVTVGLSAKVSRKRNFVPQLTFDKDYRGIANDCLPLDYMTIDISSETESLRPFKNLPKHCLNRKNEQLALYCKHLNKFNVAQKPSFAILKQPTVYWCVLKDSATILFELDRRNGRLRIQSKDVALKDTKASNKHKMQTMKNVIDYYKFVEYNLFPSEVCATNILNNFPKMLKSSGTLMRICSKGTNNAPGAQMYINPQSMKPYFGMTDVKSSETQFQPPPTS